MARVAPPLWAGYLTAGSMAIALGAALEGSAASLVVNLGISASATTAMAIGLRHHRPRHRGPWLVTLLALLCFNVDDLVAVLGPARAVSAGPGSIAVWGYPLLLGAVVLLMRRLQTRNRDLRRGALLDVGIVVLGGGLLVWQFVVAPAVRAGGGVPHAVSASVVPIVELAILAVILRLAMGAMSQGDPALRLLVGALLAALVSGFLQAAAQVGDIWLAALTGGLVGQLAYLLAGAAALHPAMPLVSERSANASQSSTARLPLLIGASLVGPTLLVVAPAFGLAVDQAVVGVTTAGVSLLVVARITQLLQLVSRQAAQLGVALAGQTRLQRDLRYQADHDSVTGLPNRAAFIACVEAALAGTTAGYAVGFLDLDDFKTVNDQSGHAVGDALLTAVGKRLRTRLREHDVVARLGGDEFGVLLHDVNDEQAAMLLGQRALDALSEPFSVAATTVHVGASLGVALVAAGPVLHVPADVPARTLVTALDFLTPPNFMTALSDADVAMYAAKRAGKNRCVFYRAAMRAQVLGRQQLAADLVLALAAGELEVAYQPIVTMAGHHPYGVEALVRWHHPKLGAVAPVDLLAAAEDGNLIPSVDKFVLGTATQQLARWRQSLPAAADLLMGINAAVETLRQPDYQEVVFRALRAAGLDVGQLVIEVTEQALLEADSLADRNVAALAESGIAISLDDFGTGYSSLSYLQRLPVRSLKLDCSFAMGLTESVRQQQLVRGVISLSHALGLLVVAEGVETEQQRSALAALDCDLAQGYLFARPLTAAQVPSYLAEHEPVHPDATGSTREAAVPVPRIPG